MILEQDLISRLPAGKLFLSIADQFGIKPDVGAFGRFLVGTSKDVLKFLKDKSANILTEIGNTLGTISYSLYVYYGEKSALSNNIVEFLEHIEKIGGLHKFQDELEKKTQIYGNIPRIYDNLLTSPYKPAIDKIIEEFKFAFSNKAILERWQKIVKDAAKFNRIYSTREFDLINIDVNNLSNFQQMIVLNNLELRQELHKKFGHPFLWLIIVKGKMLPINIGKKGRKLGSVNWINKEYGLDRTGISEEWLKNALKPDALIILSEAIAKDENLKKEVVDIISKFASPLQTLDVMTNREQLISILTVLDQNISNGLLFFGDEDIIFDIVKTKLLDRNDISGTDDDSKKRLLFINKILHNTRNLGELATTEQSDEEERKEEIIQTPRAKAIENNLKQLFSKLSGISVQTLEELKDTGINDSQLASTIFKRGLTNVATEHDAIEKMFAEKYPFKDSKLTGQHAIYEYMMRRNWNVLTIGDDATLKEFFRNAVKLTEKFIDNFDSIVAAYEEKVEKQAGEEKEESKIKLNLREQTVLQFVKDMFQMLTKLSNATLKEHEKDSLSDEFFQGTVFVVGLNNSERTQKVIKNFIPKLPYNNVEKMLHYTEAFIEGAKANWSLITHNNELTLGDFFRSFVLFVEAFHSDVEENTKKPEKKKEEEPKTKESEAGQKPEQEKKPEKTSKKKKADEQKKDIKIDQLYEYTAENKPLSTVIVRVIKVSNPIELHVEYSPHKDDIKHKATRMFAAGRLLQISRDIFEESSYWKEITEDELTAKLEDVSDDEKEEQPPPPKKPPKPKIPPKKQKAIVTKKKKIDENSYIETLDDNNLLLELKDRELLLSLNDFLITKNNIQTNTKDELFKFNGIKITDVFLTKNYLKLVSERDTLIASL